MSVKVCHVDQIDGLSAEPLTSKLRRHLGQLQNYLLIHFLGISFD